jgi:hypothetical protein
LGPTEDLITVMTPQAEHDGREGIWSAQTVQVQDPPLKGETLGFMCDATTILFAAAHLIRRYDAGPITGRSPAASV